MPGVKSRPALLVLAALGVALLVLLLRPRSGVVDDGAGPDPAAAAPVAGSLEEGLGAPRRSIADSPSSEEAAVAEGEPAGEGDTAAAAEAEVVLPRTLLVVEAETGRPIAGAEVLFLPNSFTPYLEDDDPGTLVGFQGFFASKSPDFVKTTTDGSGRVAVPAAEENPCVLARSPGRIGGMQSLPVGAEEVRLPLRTVPEPIVFVGRVLGPDGEPLAREFVSLEVFDEHPDGRSGMNGRPVPLGADGAFRHEVTESLAPDVALRLVFRVKTEEGVLEAERRFDAPVARTVHDLGDVVLEPQDEGDVFVAGVVVRADGTPVDAWVSVEARDDSGRWGRTGLNGFADGGRFVFRREPAVPGPYRVSAQADGTEATRDFRPGEHDVEVRLPAMGSIRIEVIGVSGKDLYQLEAFLFQDGRPVRFGNSFRQRPGEPMEWTLTALDGGTYDLVLTSRGTGAELWRRSGLVVVPGEDPLPVVVDLQGRIRIADVEVFGADGRRVREVSVRPADAPPDTRPSSSRNPFRAFLTSDSVRVVLGAPGWRQGEFTLRPGERRIELEPAIRVRLQVDVPDSLPPGWRLDPTLEVPRRGVPASGPLYAPTPGAEPGLFLVPAPGRYAVEVTLRPEPKPGEQLSSGWGVALVAQDEEVLVGEAPEQTFVVRLDPDRLEQSLMPATRARR